MVESIYLCIAGIAICIYLVRDQRRRSLQADLLKRGFKICGKVRHVRYEWLVRRFLTGQYELYAEFEFDGKTHYALQKFWFKPRWQAGDPIGICFDPADPDINMILDFSNPGIDQ